ncbi:hypothetical protein BGZ60DRAFT_527819 [Tricladium varicosporioides]|nr:hypothetical protein BGZ60DRAFT_527819 [Hymenoscyphus varicosporioides]
MARILAEEVMGLIIGAFLGVVGTLTSPGTVVLVAVTLTSSTGLKKMAAAKSTSECSQAPHHHLPPLYFYQNLKFNRDYPINDPNIGALNIFFQPSKFNTAPFPGDVLLQNDKFKTKSENHGMRLSDGVKYSGFTSKDCKGKTVKATVCKEGFPDGSTGNLSGIKTKGWAYYVGFPTGGRSAGCPKKREIEWEG